MSRSVGSSSRAPAAPAQGQVTDRLAAWCVEAGLPELPDEVTEATRLLMLDALGCALFGATTPWGRIVADFAHDSASGGEATLWGTPGQRVPASQAPLANGTFVHSFEFDDLHPKAVVHGGAQVVPAAMAIAELRARGPARSWLPPGAPDAGELLIALVVGLEASARIGLATGARSLERGFHPSPNTGTFGAAATSGRLLRLDATQMAHAFGIAGSGGGALMAAQYGAMVKRMHPGLAAQSGVQAALLAARGFTGTGEVLEAPYGGFAHAHAGAEAVAVAGTIADGLGERWETLEYGVKPYPCCGSSHTAVDAYLSILQEYPDLRPEVIDRIDVESSSVTREHVGWPWRPAGVTAAQMNLPYTLAVLAADRTLGVDQFHGDRTQDASLAELAERVVVRASPDLDAQGHHARHTVRLTITTTTGRRFSREVTHPRGRKPYRLGRDEVIAKYRDLAGHVLETSGVAAVERLVLGLGTTDGPSSGLIEDLSAALVPGASEWTDTTTNPATSSGSRTQPFAERTDATKGTDAV